MICKMSVWAGKKKQLKGLPPPSGWRAREAWRGSGWECSKILFQGPEGAVASGPSSGPSFKTCLASAQGTFVLYMSRDERVKTTCTLFSGLHWGELSCLWQIETAPLCIFKSCLLWPENIFSLTNDQPKVLTQCLLNNRTISKQQSSCLTLNK